MSDQAQVRVWWIRLVILHVCTITSRPGTWGGEGLVTKLFHWLKIVSDCVPPVTNVFVTVGPDPFFGHGPINKQLLVSSCTSGRLDWSGGNSVQQLRSTWYKNAEYRTSFASVCRIRWPYQVENFFSHGQPPVRWWSKIQLVGCLCIEFVFRAEMQSASGGLERFCDRFGGDQAPQSDLTAQMCIFFIALHLAQLLLMEFICCPSKNRHSSAFHLWSPRNVWLDSLSSHDRW